MHIDKYGIPIYNSADIFKLIYQGHSDKLSQIDVNCNDDLKQLESLLEIKFKTPLPGSLTVTDFDTYTQEQWFMPEEYKDLNIEEHILSLIPPWDSNNQRVLDELAEFKNRDMLNVLRWLKYFVDTCNQNNIVWGVGRGSSVASYVLFLLGVHRIDSVKYNLDWRDFLR